MHIHEEFEAVDLDVMIDFLFQVCRDSYNFFVLKSRNSLVFQKM